MQFVLEKRILNIEVDWRLKLRGSPLSDILPQTLRQRLDGVGYQHGSDINAWDSEFIDHLEELASITNGKFEDVSKSLREAMQQRRPDRTNPSCHNDRLVLQDVKKVLEVFNQQKAKSNQSVRKGPELRHCDLTNRKR